jgi:hypothetical protein
MVKSEQLGEESGLFGLNYTPYPWELLCEYIQLLHKKE